MPNKATTQIDEENVHDEENLCSVRRYRPWFMKPQLSEHQLGDLREDVEFILQLIEEGRVVKQSTTSDMCYSSRKDTLSRRKFLGETY